MRKIAHIIKLDQDYYLNVDGSGQCKVLALYIDEFGTESGCLLRYPDGKVMSCDSDIFDEISDEVDDNGHANRIYMTKADMRGSVLDKLLPG